MGLNSGGIFCLFCFCGSWCARNKEKGAPSKSLRAGSLRQEPRANGSNKLGILEVHASDTSKHKRHTMLSQLDEGVKIELPSLNAGMSVCEGLMTR